MFKTKISIFYTIIKNNNKIMNHLTTKQFREIIFDFGTDSDIKNNWKYKGDNPCILLFSAEWCSPCRMVTPILEELEKEGNFNLYKVDTDEEYELSKLFNIRSIPTILFVPIEGNPVAHTGSFPKNELKKFISKYFKV